MPRPRFDNIDPEKKERLLAAAVKEFAAHGYELASINTILDAAEFSKGSFYYYFDDKADLATTVLAQYAHRALEPFKTLSTPHTADEFWAELRRFSRAGLDMLKSERVYTEAITRLASSLLKDPTFSARVAPHLADSRRLIAGFFERGVAVGAIRSDVPVGAWLAITEAMKTAAFNAFYPADKVPTESDLEWFTDFIMDLVKRITSR